VQPSLITTNTAATSIVRGLCVSGVTKSSYPRCISELRPFIPSTGESIVAACQLFCNQEYQSLRPRASENLATYSLTFSDLARYKSRLKPKVATSIACHH
jgi:hypothetical protein